MNTEPVRLVSLVNAALSATLGVLAIILDWSPELVGGLTVAIAAWIIVAGELARRVVTPAEAPRLTVEQAAKVEIVP